MSELLNVLENRAILYRVTGSIYQLELTPQSLAELKSVKFPEDTSNDGLNAASAKLNAAVAKLDDSELDELAADYARIFLSAGVTGGKAAFPYESVYTSPQRIIMQDAYEAVYKVLKGLGLKPANEDLYADHMGIELEIMSHLSGKTSEAIKADRIDTAEKLLADQKKFLSEHLLNWCDKFFYDQSFYASTDFYKAVGEFTNAFLVEDAKWLSEGEA